jgi:hypothetical protein
LSSSLNTETSSEIPLPPLTPASGQQQEEEEECCPEAGLCCWLWGLRCLPLIVPWLNGGLMARTSKKAEKKQEEHFNNSNPAYLQSGKKNKKLIFLQDTNSYIER